MARLTVDEVVQLLEVVEQARTERVQSRTVGVRTVDVDLAAISTTVAFPLNVRGYALVMPAYAQPAGASLLVVVDGVPFPFQSGAKLKSPFQRIEVFNTSSGANSGSARFFVVTQPDCDVDFGALGDGNLQAASYTAAHNVTTNIPTLVTEGVSLANGKGARAVVSVGAGQTITSGTGVWWLYDDLTGLWAESVVQVDLSRTTARRAVSVPDEFVTVGRGRAFLEVRSGVNSGAAAFNVSLFAN